MKNCQTADDYISANPHWREALTRLRNIILATELSETVKWGVPVYTLNGKNVVGLGAFKSYVGIWFFQGVYLKDRWNKLTNAQEGKTKALRQWRFNSNEEIEPALITEYLLEAIENQKAGKVVKPQKSKTFKVPDELSQALREDAGLKKCFEGLTLAKQREYAEYITDAKRADTKTKRLEKIKPMILHNLGLNDQYR